VGQVLDGLVPSHGRRFRAGPPASSRDQVQAWLDAAARPWRGAGYRRCRHHCCQPPEILRGWPIC
jgi:hypothetical protein